MNVVAIKTERLIDVETDLLLDFLFQDFFGTNLSFKEPSSHFVVLFSQTLKHGTHDSKELKSKPLLYGRIFVGQSEGAPVSAPDVY